VRCVPVERMPNHARVKTSEVGRLKTSSFNKTPPFLRPQDVSFLTEGAPRTCAVGPTSIPARFHVIERTPHPPRPEDMADATYDGLVPLALAHLPPLPYPLRPPQFWQLRNAFSAQPQSFTRISRPRALSGFVERDHVWLVTRWPTARPTGRREAILLTDWFDRVVVDQALREADHPSSGRRRYLIRLPPSRASPDRLSSSSDR